jgi:anaerobic selenocysteine-containing dehydrogenase
MLPESETTVRALESREFVVVVDSFLTDTARHAHLVLPTTTLLEADDLLGSYGHHWIGVARPVVPPPDGVRSDLEIVQGLAERVGLAEAMAGDARAWKRRLVEKKLAPDGVTLEALEERPVRSPLASKILFADRKFATPSGRVNLMTEAPPAGEPSEEYPLFLMALSTEKAQSSQWATPQEGPISATVHPDAAKGIADGALCRLESRVSSLIVRLSHDPGQRRDVVILPKGGHMREGRCANVLVRARTSDLGEGAALYDEQVRILPV